MEIEGKRVVSIHYKICNRKGDLLEDNTSGLPISYLHGFGNILPSLEAALVGLKAGDKKQIYISNKMGFEGLDDDFFMDITVDNIRMATAEELIMGLNTKEMKPQSCSGKGCCTDELI